MQKELRLDDSDKHKNRLVTRPAVVVDNQCEEFCVEERHVRVCSIQEPHPNNSRELHKGRSRL